MLPKCHLVLVVLAPGHEGLRVQDEVLLLLPRHRPPLHLGAEGQVYMEDSDLYQEDLDEGTPLLMKLVQSSMRSEDILASSSLSCRSARKMGSNMR